MNVLSFRAMGSDCRLAAVGDARGLLSARRLVGDLESRWSRFLPSSELSALNRAAGTVVAVSAETTDLVALAIEAWRLTDGRFDPTVLPSLLAAGYRSTFGQIGSPDRDEASPAPGCHGIVVDPPTIELPHDLTLDLGGIGKGRAADLAVDALMAAGAAGAMADLGGDVRVAGRSPDGDGGWAVAVEDPCVPGRDLASLRVTAGAVATSSVLRRAWADPSGRTAHHLIDPRTGEPAHGGVTAATVLAGTAVAAEVLAKAAVIAGPVDGAALVASLGATGLLVLDDGTVLRVGGLDRFEGAA